MYGRREIMVQGCVHIRKIPMTHVRLSGVLMLSAIEKHSAVVQRINTPRLDIFANKSLEE